MATQGWNEKEDRRQSGGCHIKMDANESGAYVRYLLLVARAPIWREKTAPVAMVIRCYEGGETTLAEETWEA